MCTKAMKSGVSLLIAAVLWSLVALPAVAHLEHTHEVSAAVGSSTSHTVTDVDLGTDRDAFPERQVTTAPALMIVLSCCGKLSGFSCSCERGMVCGSASCGSCSGALLGSHVIDLIVPVRALAACYPNILLTGDVPGPHDRPPASDPGKVRHRQPVEPGAELTRPAIQTRIDVERRSHRTHVFR